MGSKRRVRNTSGLRGPVSAEVLNRYAVASPISFAELKFENERAAEKRRRKAKKESV